VSGIQRGIRRIERRLYIVPYSLTSLIRQHIPIETPELFNIHLDDLTIVGSFFPFSKLMVRFPVLFELSLHV